MAKFFPMGGEKSLPELYSAGDNRCPPRHERLSSRLAAFRLIILGIILQTCLEVSVLRVMPHVYSSIYRSG